MLYKSWYVSVLGYLMFPLLLNEMKRRRVIKHCEIVSSYPIVTDMIYRISVECKSEDELKIVECLINKYKVEFPPKVK